MTDQCQECAALRAQVAALEQARDQGQPQFLLDQDRAVLREQHSHQDVESGRCDRCYQVAPCRTIQELDWIDNLIAERDAMRTALEGIEAAILDAEKFYGYRRLPPIVAHQAKARAIAALRRKE